MRLIYPTSFFQNYFTVFFLLRGKLFYVVDGKDWMLCTFAMKSNTIIILWSGWFDFSLCLYFQISVLYLNALSLKIFHFFSRHWRWNCHNHVQQQMLLGFLYKSLFFPFFFLTVFFLFSKFELPKGIHLIS